VLNLAELLDLQSGVVRRAQLLEAGLSPHEIRGGLRRREWTPVFPGVYVNHTGPLTWMQRAWAGVLAVWPAALCGESALRAVEGPGRRGRSDAIHVAVGSGRNVVVPDGIRITRMKHLDARALWNTSPPRLRFEDATLDVALEAATDFEAIAVLANAVQGRRTTAARMLSSLSGRERVARRRWLTDVLSDIAEGTCSVLEHGYLNRVERAHGLPRAKRQVPGVASARRIYRDVECETLIIELDGRLFHDSARGRDADFERDLDAAVDGRDSVRLSWGQVFERPCSTAAKVAALLAKRGWPGQPRPCGPDCRLRC